MFKFLTGYVVGIVITLGAVFIADKPAHAFVDDESKWYPMTMVMPVPGKVANMIFDHPGNTKEECQTWIKTHEFTDRLAEVMSDLVTKFPKIKALTTECVQPPPNSQGDPA